MKREKGEVSGEDDDHHCIGFILYFCSSQYNIYIEYSLCEIKQSILMVNLVI